MPLVYYLVPKSWLPLNMDFGILDPFPAPGFQHNCLPIAASVTFSFSRNALHLYEEGNGADVLRWGQSLANPQVLIPFQGLVLGTKEGRGTWHLLLGVSKVAGEVSEQMQ